jgi:hypothetical protein
VVVRPILLICVQQLMQAPQLLRQAAFLFSTGRIEQFSLITRTTRPFANYFNDE